MDIVRISTKSNKMSKRTKQLKNTINEINTHTHTHMREAKLYYMIQKNRSVKWKQSSENHPSLIARRKKK